MQDGMATVLLVVAILFLMPLTIRLFQLGSLSAPLPILLLLASAAALVFVGFHIHRALESAFHEAFVAPIPRVTAPTAEASTQDDVFSPIDPETPSLRDGQHTPAGNPRRSAGDPERHSAEEAAESLWRILEEHMAKLRYPNRTRDPNNRAPDPDRTRETGQRIEQPESD